MSKKDNNYVSSKYSVKEQSSETQSNETDTTSSVDTSELIKPEIPEVKAKEVTIETTTETETEDKVEAKKVTSKRVYRVEFELSMYSENMAPGKSIDPIEGGRWQFSLLTTIRGILSARDQETFNKEWNTLLAVFHENKNKLYTENYLFRFPEQWPGSELEFAFFRRIVYAALRTADPKTRKAAIKDVNLELLTSTLNQDQRNKIINFYS